MTSLAGQRPNFKPIERARLYLDRIPGAVSGAGGHDQTYSAACVATHGFALTEAEAMEVMREFNQRCDPPWSERDLLHKVQSAAKANHSKPRGHLLGENSRIYRPQQQAAPAEKARPLPDRSGFNRGTRDQFEALSKLRGIGLPGIHLADERGLLFFGEWFGFQCWGVSDSSGKVLEIRRMDGDLFPAHGELQARKSHAVRGSRKAWPVGILEAKRFPKIALMEGMPDFLEAHHLTVWEGKPDVAVVSILSASPAIDSEALEHFRGKRVRIFPHAEKAGAKGALKWAKQLESIGATVDCFDFAGLRQLDGSPVNDLLDYSNIAHEEFLSGRAPYQLLP